MKPGPLAPSPEHVALVAEFVDVGRVLGKAYLISESYTIEDCGKTLREFGMAGSQTEIACWSCGQSERLDRMPRQASLFTTGDDS